jgi:predicted amidophosphoribosyltransferase
MQKVTVIGSPRCVRCTNDALSGHPFCPSCLAQLEEFSPRLDGLYCPGAFQGVLPFRGVKVSRRVKE